VAIRIAGTTDYNRKDNRIETAACVSFEGEVYQVLDIGLGGFRIGGYEGELMPGQEFMIDGIGLDEDNIVAVRVDCTVARRLGNQLGVGFVELDPLSFDVLDALMMRRKKFFEKMKNARRIAQSGLRILHKALWIGFNVGDFRGLPIPHGIEETVPPAGVAGDADLIDHDQHRIGVTIPAKILQRLRLARAFSLAPQFSTRAGPVTHTAGF